MYHKNQLDVYIPIGYPTENGGNLAMVPLIVVDIYWVPIPFLKGSLGTRVPS